MMNLVVEILRKDYSNKWLEVKKAVEQISWKTAKKYSVHNKVLSWEDRWAFNFLGHSERVILKIPNKKFGESSIILMQMYEIHYFVWFQFLF